MGDSSGSIIGGKYRLGPILGRGGMGVVREAAHVRLGTKFAVKLLHDTSDPLERIRFEREALAASALHNRHVVRVFDVGATDEGTPYMVMELLRGRDVMDVYRDGTAIDVTRAVDWMIQVCSAMYEAHGAGIIHRDLKPSNLFLADAGGAELVKVVDFGISKVLSAKELTVQATFVGTPQYMAPEQLRAEVIDHRVDLYSMGVILYRLLSRRYPIAMEENLSPIVAAIKNLTVAATPLSVHRPDLPPDLVATVMRALAPDRDQRFADARALAHALEPHGSGTVRFEDSHEESHRGALLDRLNEGSPMFGVAETPPPSSLGAMGEPTRITAPAPKTRAPWIAGGLGLLLVVGVVAGISLRRPADLPAPAPPVAAPVAAAPPATLPAADAPAPAPEPVASAAPPKTPPRTTRNPVKPTAEPAKPTSLPTHL